jgi:hypothetical protein
MAVRLPHSIYIHLMKTGGWTVRTVLARAGLHLGEIGREHDPACLLQVREDISPFAFVFIRHPLTWYRSYWAFRMQTEWSTSTGQQITGWQTYGSILDHECRSNDFEKWICNILDYMPEGFLSRVYRIYTERVNFVGRVEYFNNDLSQALTLAGEEFSLLDFKNIPKCNVTDAKYVASARMSQHLAEKVMIAESYIVQKWGYDWIPEKILRTADSAKT